MRHGEFANQEHRQVDTDEDRNEREHPAFVIADDGNASSDGPASVAANAGIIVRLASHSAQATRWREGRC